MLDAAAVTWRNDLRSILISSSLSKRPLARPAMAGKSAVAGHLAAQTLSREEFKTKYIPDKGVGGRNLRKGLGRLAPGAELGL